MVKESTDGLISHITKGNSKKGLKVETELGEKEPVLICMNMLGNIYEIKNTEMVHLNGRVEISMWDNITMTNDKVKEQ